MGAVERLHCSTLCDGEIARRHRESTRDKNIWSLSELEQRRMWREAEQLGKAIIEWVFMPARAACVWSELFW